MDHTSRTIYLSLFLVLGLALVALVASLIVPFNVEQDVTVRAFEGMVQHVARDGTSVLLAADTNGNIPLDQGETLHLQTDSRVVLRVFNGGQIVLDGPAALTLVESYRRATFIGHALDSDSYERDYVLVFEQIEGRARYLFGNATPAFSDVSITVELPDRDYVPTTRCWEIAVEAGSSTSLRDITCPQ